MAKLRLKQFGILAVSGILGVASAVALMPWGAGTAVADEDSGRVVVMRDDCDPNDPGWPGGCARHKGDVTFAEFVRELDSPLALAVVGHQAWRNDPTYMELDFGDTLKVQNRGGRVHTFTRVSNFGGGKVPPPAGIALNEGLITAPECPSSIDVPPGGKTDIEGLAAGDHRFQCCFHPWMRALVKVKER